MKNLLALAGALMVCILVAGCGDKPYTVGKEEMAAFKNAAPELKQIWDDALKADKSNDYLTAGNHYRSLLAKGITPEQMAAVQTALGGLNIRLNEAAAKGDAAAQKALEAAKASGPRR